MIFNWAPRGPFQHANETSWYSNKLNITTPIQGIATLKGKKKNKRLKKKNLSKITRKTSLDIPCLLGRQTVSLLWEEYAKQIYIYNCFLRGWLKLKSFCQASQRKREQHFLILWLLLANSLGREEVTCWRWWVRNRWGCPMETQL